MSVYYVRISGSDSNNGLTPATAWRTFGKALGATGISSGDILYIGAGIYRESVTINLTSPTSETQIIGDVNGIYTGDSGKVILTSNISGNKAPGNASAVLAMIAKNNLTFKNLTFISTNSNNVESVTVTTTSKNIKFYKCIFKSAGVGGSNGLLYFQVNLGVTTDSVVDSCMFFPQNSGAILISLATGSGEDYDANILIKNCYFHSTGTNGMIIVLSSGTSNNEGGGIKVINCTKIGGSGPMLFINATTRISAQGKYPCIIYNCLSYGGGIVSTEFGAIIENYNVIIASTPRTNVSVGLNSITVENYIPLFDIGESQLFNFNPLTYCQPDTRNLLGLQGNGIIAPDVDILGYPNKAGQVGLLFDGTIDSFNNQTIDDSDRRFGNDSTLKGYNLKILDGPAANYTKTIFGNTNTGISGDGLWPINPVVNNKYEVYAGPNSYIGIASGGTINSVTDAYAGWTSNFWKGYTLRFISGTASGENMIIFGNSSTVLSGYQNMALVPASGDIYEMFWGTIYKGIVSTGTNISLTDNNISWNGFTGQSGVWVGYVCVITEGVASGAYTYVSGNSYNTLSGWSNFAITPTSGDKYCIYQYTGYPTGIVPMGYIPPFDRNYIGCNIGCYAIPNTAIRESGIVLSGQNSIRLFGPGIQDFQFPVSGGVSNTINVWGYFDDYYSGVKPQMIIKNGSGIGIADNVGTMLGNSGQWEQISLSFIPTSNGIITVRLQSNTTGIGGSAYFDAFSVT